MRIAIVGATGLVGRTMISVLEKSALPIKELVLAASAKSAGKEIEFQGNSLSVTTVEKCLESKVDVALFSAGGAVSQQYAPLFVEKGAWVIDNSSYWRMNQEVPLVVPEINFNLKNQSRLIANPNCSTIQLVMALFPLQKHYGLKRVVVSTYQSVSGTGVVALEQMEAERRGETTVQSPYPHPIDMNCLPHCGSFLENAYTTEEMKLVLETRKILNLPNLAITTTNVRVPVRVGHSEAVNVELNEPFNLSDIIHFYKEMAGVMVEDEPKTNLYPLPITAEGKNEVFIGRLRRDESVDNGLNMWVVSDNLRKGAATNAVQIVERLFNVK